MAIKPLRNIVAYFNLHCLTPKYTGGPIKKNDFLMFEVSLNEPAKISTLYYIILF